jgi:hypothetical protein
MRDTLDRIAILGIRLVAIAGGVVWIVGEVRRLWR